MPRYLRSKLAEDDLLEIWVHIARDNEGAADRVLDRIEGAFNLLANNPALGPARPDLRPKIRHFVVGSYLIFYRPISDGVEILRVAHGARFLPDLVIPNLP